MQRKNFGNMECPVARSLERVGEWWSILIMRDALYGMTRFDEFQKNLKIAPNMLTRRLSAAEQAQVRPAAKAWFAPALGRRRRVTDICLFVQHGAGLPFVPAERVALAG